MLRKYDFIETEEIKKTMQKLGGGPEVKGASIGIVDGKTVNFMVDDGMLKHYVKMNTEDARKFAVTLLEMCEKAENRNKEREVNNKAYDPKMFEKIFGDLFKKKLF